MFYPQLRTQLSYFSPKKDEEKKTQENIVLNALSSRGPPPMWIYLSPRPALCVSCVGCVDGAVGMLGGDGIAGCRVSISLPRLSNVFSFRIWAFFSAYRSRTRHPSHGCSYTSPPPPLRLMGARSTGKFMPASFDRIICR